MLPSCLSGVWAAALLSLARGFLYQPQSGQIWDPSCFASVDGNRSYYCVAMYQKGGDPTNYYTAGLLFASDDGVHWRTVGPVAPSANGTQWWKGFVLQLPDGSYVMDHGVLEHGQNDALRILTAPSTEHLGLPGGWTAAATSRPGAGFRSTGRWDHMYMSALDGDGGGGGGVGSGGVGVGGVGGVGGRGGGGGGYIGFAVASPLNSTAYAGTWPAVQRSPDAVHWTAAEPLAVEWGGVSPQGIEEGGFERLQVPVPGAAGGGSGGAGGSSRSSSSSNASKFFLIGGGGAARGGMSYSMWVFEADAVEGPYRPAARRFRLSGGGSRAPSSFSWGALAAWCRGRDGERLISQYVTAQGKGRSNVWMLPLRKPVLDASGALRLGWWGANDAMLGAPLPGHAPPPGPR